MFRVVRFTVVILACVVIGFSQVAGQMLEQFNIPVMLEKSGTIVLKKLLKDIWTEHMRVYPVENNAVFLVPAGDFGGSRISVNFDHRSWVPRGSAPVRVYGS